MIGGGALEWLVAGTLLVLAGALVKFRGWTFLLAGHDSTAAVPEAVVADVAGSTVLRVGIATAALGAVMLQTELPSRLRLLFGALVVVAVLRMVYRVRTYSPDATG